MSKSNENIEQRVVMASVDDVDFCISGENIEKKMQEIASYCMEIHEATGGR